MFVNLRTSLTTNDNKAVVNEVERGEDYIKAKFEEAMQDNDVSSGTKTVITDVYASVRDGHDQMRDMKKSFERA